ncbi:MAG: OmpH family outer membrane protein [Bacteroidetes bacterium]|nr:OmpH family outer membrane protein [Bacteroidota bacterium]
MKNLSTVFSILALAGVIVLFTMNMSGKKESHSTASATSPASEGFASTGKIAYVNIDSLENNYEYLKNEKIKFETNQAAMKAELDKSAQQFQNDVAAYQRKVQAGTISQPEAQATEKRLGQMQQSFKAREEALNSQLMKAQEDFTKQLQAELDRVIAEFNQDKKYDYILSYMRSGQILYANKSLDVTGDVLKMLNDRYKNNGGAEQKK